MDLLLQLALVLVAAKAAGWVFERLAQPAVIGEVLAGVALGPHALGLIEHSTALEVLQQAGAVILLFLVGLDTPLQHLRAVGGRAAGVGVAGIVLPFAAGVGVMAARGGGGTEALFLGTAMVATSVGVTARVLADLGVVKRPESRVILGAAVVDDVLGLIALAVVAAATGSALSLGQSVLLGAAIVGFFIGMALASTGDRSGLERKTKPIYWVVVPYFFVASGTHFDAGVAGGAIGFAAVVVIVAVAGKLIGSGIAAAGMGRRSALIVGIGMVPRGEIGILVATIGLERGLVGEELYGVVLVMAIVTTLIVPPALKALFGTELRPTRGPRTAEIEGIGG